MTTATEVVVTLRTPHPKQALFVDSAVKRIIICAGRRGGKTVGVAIKAVKALLAGQRVLYAAPTGEQTDRFWFEVCRALHNVIEAGTYRKNETERYIERPGTQNRIKAKTAWNANMLRGDYADLLILEEWQLMAEDIWEDVGAPMLIDNNGDAVFIYTPPSLRSSGVSKAKDPRHASKMFKMAQADTSGRWAAFHFTSFDNPYLPREALAEVAQDMSRDSFRKEILAEDDELETSWLVHGKFNESLCKIPRFAVPTNWDVYSGHDFGCVDTETEILTLKGWLKEKDVSDNEVVLTLNPATGLAEWQTILAMNRYQGIFPMRLIEQRGHNSLTTANHRWLVQKRKSGKLVFETSETLKASDNVKCAAPCSTLPTEPVYRDSFVELVAWFWTEGQIDAGGISIWQNEGEKAAQIRRCLTSEYGEPLVNTRNGRERAAAGWLERPHRKGYSPTSGLPTGHELCHFAINMNGADRLLAVAPHRIVKPEFIASLTTSQLQLFIETSIKGDGWQRQGRGGKQAAQSLSQSERVRLEPFQIACTLAGIRTYLHQGEEKSYVSLYKRPNFQIGKACQKRILYEGVVWCPTTPNGTWLARRKGTVYFTGNSANPAALFIARAKGPPGPNQPVAPGAPLHMRMNDLVVFREYLPGPGNSTAQNVNCFQELMEGYTVRRSVGGNKTTEDEIRQAYAAHGWPIQEPSTWPVKLQFDRVVGLEELNKLYVFDDLYGLIAEMAGCMWVLDDTNRPTTGKIKDEAQFHLLAAARYILSEFLPETTGQYSVTGGRPKNFQMWDMG